MKFEFSAGGVVFKKTTSKTFILIAQHSFHHNWVFPKGLIGDEDKNETKEQTAIREVEEETGIKAKILAPLKPVTFWYVFEGKKIKKTVYYFLMEHISGDTTKHDFEMEAVEWIPENKVFDKLAYKSDKKVWEDAKKLISNN